MPNLNRFVALKMSDRLAGQLKQFAASNDETVSAVIRRMVRAGLKAEAVAADDR